MRCSHLNAALGDEHLIIGNIMSIDNEFGKLVHPAAKYISENFPNRPDVTPCLDLRKKIVTEDGIVTEVEFSEFGRVLAVVKYLYRNGSWERL